MQRGSGRRYTTNTRMCANRQHTKTHRHTYLNSEVWGLTTGKSTYSLRKSWDMKCVKSPKSARKYKPIHFIIFEDKILFQCVWHSFFCLLSHWLKCTIYCFAYSYFKSFKKSKLQGRIHTADGMNIACFVCLHLKRFHLHSSEDKVKPNTFRKKCVCQRC